MVVLKVLEGFIGIIVLFVSGGIAGTCLGNVSLIENKLDCTFCNDKDKEVYAKLRLKGIGIFILAFIGLGVAIFLMWDCAEYFCNW